MKKLMNELLFVGILSIGMTTGFLSFSAQAALIDFQQLEHADDLFTFHGTQYVEDGFQLSSPSLTTFGTLAIGYTGSTAMFSNENNGDTQLSKVGGGVFDLVSIDLAELIGDSVSSITFTRDGGHSQIFTLDGVFGVETFFFDSGFLESSFVTWSQTASAYQFDNIEVSSVPVPAAVWLFGSGLLGLIGLARRNA